jgi:hypothetical protein
MGHLDFRAAILDAQPFGLYRIGGVSELDLPGRILNSILVVIAMRHSITSFILAIFLAAANSSVNGEPAPFMMQATVAGRLIEGQPLAWTQTQMLLLGRDGALHDFDPAQAKDAKRTATAFAAYSSGEMAARLRAEFGPTFDVSTSPHFVVVHPRGPWRDWAERLEALYRSFTHYIGVRGFHPTAPNVPLVAVVFRTQDDYFRYAAAGGTNLQPGTLGHYDPTSNRMFLFDESGGKAELSANVETIIHEATHQTAYNVGVHRRFAEQPRWAVEGLAMMFEARGVWDAKSGQDQTARLNRERLEYFRRTGDKRPADWLLRMVAGERRFDDDALSAYAESWALTFYLCETRPQQYCGYLAQVAAREPFTEYSSLERMSDFTKTFGSDLKLLAAHLRRFVDELP